MATYPTLATRYGSDPEPINSLAIDRAEDGTARGRAMMTTDKVRVTIVHPYMTAADKATLDAFYTDNRLIPFDYTSPADEIARSMIFAGPPKWERAPGNRWTATVDIEEV